MCPSCEKGRLHPTGAFWVCDLCGLVITERALSFAKSSKGASKTGPVTKETSPTDSEALEAGDIRETGSEPRRPEL